MNRTYLNVVKEHFDNATQALFLSGPRQVGKTTIAKAFLQESVYPKYVNRDNLDNRQLILSGPSAVAQELPSQALLTEKPTICIDEIHKFRNWKGFLKDFY